MKIVFMGTPDIAKGSLQKLIRLKTKCSRSSYSS